MEISKTFEGFLIDNNITYNKIEAGIFFSHEQKNFLLLLDSMDVVYYRLTLPKIEVPERLNKEKLNEILLQLTSEFKVAKAIDTGEGGIWFSYEQILCGESVIDYNYVFSRSIKILSEMLDKYSVYVIDYLHQTTEPENIDAVDAVGH